MGGKGATSSEPRIARPRQEVNTDRQTLLFAPTPNDELTAHDIESGPFEINKSGRRLKPISATNRAAFDARS